MNNNSCHATHFYPSESLTSKKFERSEFKLSKTKFALPK